MPGQEFRYVWHCPILEHEDNEMIYRTHLIAAAGTSRNPDCMKLVSRAYFYDAFTVQRIVRVRKTHDFPTVAAPVEGIGFIPTMARLTIEIKDISRPHMRHAIRIDSCRSFQNANVPGARL